MANANRRRNCLKKIKVNGTWLSEDQDIQRGVVRAFQNLLSDPGGWRPCLNNLEFDSIGVEEAVRLEEMFSALSVLNGDKAPGPDGFSFAFWQFCWDFVKVEVMGFFKGFFERGKFVRSLNNTFLVLIPTKGGAEDLSDFRPISLVGSLYKLLAKVLANRLKKVVGKVVSSTQSAFVEGRQILDAALIANESTRGLRQGDPLSPYLFVLGMEALSSLINRAVRGGFLSGCRIRGREGVEIQVSHLLFADDTLVFCEDSQEQLAFLSWLLMWFEANSSLRINLNKSEILPVGRVENAELLVAELGCKVGYLPYTYLGIPLGASHKSMRAWDGVEERMRKRLALWKRQFISKGGRITLIRSTLASMPIYLMSLLPKSGPSCANGVGVLRMRGTPIGSILLVQSLGLKEAGGVPEGLGRDMGWGFGRKLVRKVYCCSTMFLSRWGMAKRVRFWKDIWCGNIPLCEAFPSLYDLSVSKDAWVADCWDSMGEEGGWTPRFFRPFNDWEMEEVERFLSTIQGKRLNADVEDRMVWKETKNEIFTVMSLYNSLDQSCAVLFPWKIIWSPYVPTNVGFFCLGSFMGEGSYSRLAQEEGLAKVLWDLVFSLFGVNWVLPFMVRDTLLDMRLKKQKRHRKIVRFYTACFGFRQPFKVLCDGTFVHHLIVNHISPPDNAVSTILGAPVKLMTTRCVLAELKSLGDSYSESLKAAGKLIAARCDHERRKSAEACFVEIIGENNPEHFFVATQDTDLRKKFQEVGVFFLLLDANCCLCVSSLIF
ncbi:rRNA-processing protein UTP23-like [Vitis vinifera]|uniref:rRNA-processing protein UTP23-like n=1 Tax=Vitis vinifera TaxID=29760 RepID=A0A438EBL0_VITVI|nr:rRNA-processing protein UTP23-like [Vitis vinifera]